MVLYTPHVAQLRRLLQGPDPIVVLAEPDDAYLDRVLTQTLQREGVEVESIDATGTWTHVVGTRRERRGENTLEEFLEDTAREVERRGHTCVLWLRDVSEDLRRPTAMGRLKAIATRWRERGRHTHEPVFGSRILVSGHDATTPPHLEHLARVTALDRIHRGEEGRVFLEAVLRPIRPDADDELLTGLLESLQGLSPAHAHRVILRAAAAGHDLERHVRLERDRMLETGAIEVRSTSNRRIGGLDVLQAHLQDVAELWNDLRSAADPMQRDRLKQLLPKGMLLLGPPGCGKSLAAEVTASVLGVPLLQLHVSRLMDRFLGGTEERLESALAIARAAAPCVLWIDELEKALAGTSGEGDGGGTGRRMLGRLLTWMQENRNEIYVVATANALDHVPPELLRRGRFDDHFVLDYPEAHERGEILSIALEEHGVAMADSDRAHLQRATVGFSGADLAALVQEASRAAWLVARRPPLREHFDRALRDFRPQSIQLAEQNEATNERLSRYDFRRASTKDGSARPIRTRSRESATQLVALLGVIGDTTLVVWWENTEGFVLELSVRDGTSVAWRGLGSQSGITDRLVAYEVIPQADELVLARDGDSIRIRKNDDDQQFLLDLLRALKRSSRGGSRLSPAAADNHEGDVGGEVLWDGRILWEGEWHDATITTKRSSAEPDGMEL